jgi:hypothetical protein
MSSLFGRLLIYKAKFTFKKAYFLAGIGIALFFVSYSISFGYWAPFEFVKNHFLLYTNAGLLGFSEYIRLHKDIGVSMKFLFQPIYNIYLKISGQELMNISSNLQILIDKENYSNVKTFFGEIFIYGGFIGGMITSFIWGGITYLFLILNVVFRDTILFIAYLILLAGLFFGWFGIYFNSLAYYEVITASLLLFILTTMIFKNGRVKILKY